jgi:hypothetical protein
MSGASTQRALRERSDQPALPAGRGQVWFGQIVGSRVGMINHHPRVSSFGRRVWRGRQIR